MTNLTSNFSYPWSYLQDYVILDSLIFPRFLLGVHWVPVIQGFIFIIPRLGWDASSSQRLKKFLWPGDSWSRLLRSVDRNRGGQLSQSPGGTPRLRGTSSWHRLQPSSSQLVPVLHWDVRARNQRFFSHTLSPGSRLVFQCLQTVDLENLLFPVSSILSPRRFLG